MPATGWQDPPDDTYRIVTRHCLALRTQERLQLTMCFGAALSALVALLIKRYLRTIQFWKVYLLVNLVICLMYFSDENSLTNGII